MKNKLITLGLLTVTLALTGCSGQTSGVTSTPTTSEQTTTSQTTAEQTTTSQTTTQTTTEQTTTEQTESEPAESVPVENEIPEGGTVYAAWADDSLEISTEGGYTEFVADSSEYSGKIVFSTDKGVSDFKLLALTYEDIDDEGKITYQIEELYTQETLAADTQLVVELTFVGEIPNYGIEYDNHTGEIQRFTVSESGFDGSVILSPF